MNIKQLQYFIDLTQTLNFTHTAQNFYISQAAITKQIQKLEEELQLQLFQRNKKTVQLSQDGHVFLPYANQIISDYYQTFQAISQYKRGEKQQIRFGYIETCDYSFLSQFFNQIKEQFSDLSIEFKSYHYDELISLYTQHELDAIITYETTTFIAENKKFLHQYPLKKYYHPHIKQSISLYDIRNYHTQIDINQLLLHLSLKEGYALLPELPYISNQNNHLISENTDMYISLYMYYHSTNKSLEYMIHNLKSIYSTRL